MKSWKTRSRRVVLDWGKFLKVENHEVELPDGTILPDWPWVVTPDSTNILAVTNEGLFIAMRQTKYAYEGTSLAVPGGYVEAGEDPLLAARRELMEETGYQADTWTNMGAYFVDGNRGVAKLHLFLAQGARKVAEIDADDLEEQEVMLLTRAQLEEGLLSGDVRVSPWVITISLGLQYLDQLEKGS